MKARRTALGMGLDALLPDKLEGDFFLCPVEDIRPSPSQPRQDFHADALEELAQSIREKGLIQPVILRKDAEGGFELIAGERRWRAAQKAGLREIPAIVREAAEDEVLELALIENLQREDLNAAEEAKAYRAVLDRTGLSQEDLAARIGKSRAAVANSLRLLSLPDPAMEALRAGAISAGHARAILAVDGDRARSELLGDILRRGLSVRQSESLAKRWASRRAAVPHRRDADTRALEDRLAKSLNARVAIQSGRKTGTGKITIHFRTLDDLDRLLSLLDGRRG